jgi:hypothetical protein
VVNHLCRDGRGCRQEHYCCYKLFHIL